MNHVSVLAILLALAPCLHAAPARVLILTGLNNHDWVSTTPVLKDALTGTGRFTVDVTEHPETLKPNELGQYDVLVSHWNSWSKKGIEAQWSPELRKAYLDFVRKGKGHVAVHAGSSSFYDWPEVQTLYGATWKLGQTGHGPSHEFPVRPTNTEHPITRGLTEFRTTDELWNRPGLQDGVTILVESFSDEDQKGTGNWEPCLTVNPFGNGRSVTLLLGHSVPAMQNSGFQALFLRATEWAATGKVTLQHPVTTGVDGDVDALLQAARGYTFGGDRKPLARIERLVALTVDPEIRARLASKIANMLTVPDVSPDVKGFCCRQLALVGSAREVPALANLLTDDTLATEARFALERIPDPAAVEAMRHALKTAKTRTQIGLINSLGIRRDASAVDAIGALVNSPDSEIVTAALGSLAKIGSPEAGRILMASGGKIPKTSEAARSRALLVAAETLAATGASPQAADIFEELLKPGHPAHVRTAAFTGRIAAGGPDAERRLREALRGSDARLQVAAVRSAQNHRSTEITLALAENLESVSPELQLHIVTTLGSRQDATALPCLLKFANDPASSLRTPAALALGQIGGAQVVLPLAEAATVATGQVQSQLRDALAALRGDKIDEMMVELLPQASEGVACELIAALEARGTGQSLPALLKQMSHTSAKVRKATVQAVGALADIDNAEALIAALDTAKTAEQRGLERALLSIAKRTTPVERATDLLIGHVKGASTARKASLLNVLGGLGAPQGKPVLEAALSDVDTDIRRAALKALAEWPDASPLPTLMAMAESHRASADGFLALRGVAAILGRSDSLVAGDKLAMLRKALTLASRPDELRALIATAGTLCTRDALELVIPYLDTPAVATEAALAATAIFGALPSEALGRNLALDAKASSPDGLEADGQASGDQAGIDGNPNTYWDEVNDKDRYRYVVTFAKPTKLSALRMVAWQHHSFSAKDFDVICDGRVARSVRNATYNDNVLVIVLPATTCTTLELNITDYYPQSPAIRELEIYDL